ncbi:FKBP12-associated protein 1 [Hanseniaspora osmophila]|uniref:FKBP12-associated protein 1 n=1 Tax=Hanseniaspora osmophila TaxID=56408 RepID=A0A1E5RN81_9ASCO|nr:FKBP12-associated protein 1 [Hanseniaspora osmophila]
MTFSVETTDFVEPTDVNHLNHIHASDLEALNEEEVPYYEQTIKEIIDGETYQCMICTVEMDPYCKMYSCDHCFRVFDFECIKQWAEKSIKRNLEKSSDPGEWKCPNCMHGFQKIPSRSTCWCGKVINPEPNLLYPNSCGQTCGAKKHGGCKEHGCLNSCHLGPHNTCSLLVDVFCNCKLHSFKEQCSSATKLVIANNNKRGDNTETFDCGTECGLLLPCGVHKCTKKCHTGFCGECDHVIETDEQIKCYCGSEHKSKIKCNEIQIRGKSCLEESDLPSSWIGAFKCKNTRQIKYACNEHEYQLDCDIIKIDLTKKENKKICPLSPDILKTCPCGKTPISHQQRQKCTDPVPTCKEVCGKILSPEHPEYTCLYKCHNGPCMDINQYIETKQCDCQYTKYLVPYAMQTPPKCYIQCDMLMSCRKHRCKEICCSGKPDAMKRSNALSKKKSFFTSHLQVDESEIEAMHICLKTCNQLLNCKIHRCTRKCHQGKCSPCIESDSNDLVCPCGKTVVLAPVRCGTVLPKCYHNCLKVGTKYPECDHNVNMHLCHEGDCPKCTTSVLKKCKCYRKTPVRTLCHINNVSCGQSCYKPLQSCSHQCVKKCHSENEPCSEVCVQTCNQIRADCGHKCGLKCHGKTDCVVAATFDKNYRCSVIVGIECDCGRIKKNVRCCDLNDSNEKLECDDECNHFQRLMQFKKALGLNSVSTNIDAETNDLGQGDISSSGLLKTDNSAQLKLTVDTQFEDLKLPYTEDVLLAFGKDKTWCKQVETFMNNFVADGSVISHHFKPMPAQQRTFIRNLANSFQLYSESQDKEPKRSVFIKKNILKGNIISVSPSMSLTDAQAIYWKYKDYVKELKIKHYKETSSKTYLNLKAPEVPTQPEPVETEFNCFVLEGKCSTMELQNLMETFLKMTLIGEVDIKQPNVAQNILVIQPVKPMTANRERDMKTIQPMVNSSLAAKFNNNVSFKMGRVDEFLNYVTELASYTENNKDSVTVDDPNKDASTSEFESSEFF